ncbi:DUF3419 family protein [Hymenobacter metallilatus]|uniref:DUF3419 family protein n=1 Tax=Hymenobacter metallilatus TaxID=2493666 RepID=A0A3R9MMD6_9BACT|nr:DUF3419 family protein [Hymenobacter metallilatus]RSK35401.1 DUF3419 family protein [Hymenobacter metallilatus]
MKTEFCAVALDCLRYSLVWEDSRTLYGALTLQPTDHVLVVTSAGCNALNALLKCPRQVTAIDLNPVQNQLLRLKMHVIAFHEHSVLRGLLGLAGPAAVTDAWQVVGPTLPDAQRVFWAAFFAENPAGILLAGRLERYVTGFLPTLAPALQAKLRQLAEFDDVAEQAAYFAAELETTEFAARFTAYFDAANLSRGRDPRLFRHAAESGGAAFYERLRAAVRTELVRDNFFFRFFFFGPEHLPYAILPPCYQRRHYELLRRQLPKLRLLEGEAVDFLRSPAGQDVTKASLSNIFEYTSAAEFQGTVQALFADGRALRVVYWNLLLDQGTASPGCATLLPVAEAASARLSRQDACFYFRNVRVLDSRLTLAPAVLSSTSTLAHCA